MAKLKKNLKLVDVFAISTGAMFSSGLFLLPGLAAAQTGMSVALAYLIAGVLMIPAMLSQAELSTAMPRAGGGRRRRRTPLPVPRAPRRTVRRSRTGGQRNGRRSG